MSDDGSPIVVSERDEAGEGPVAKRRRTHRTFGEGEIVLLAGGAWIGARLALDVPLVFGLTALVLVVLARSPRLGIGALFLVACGLGHRADAGYDLVVAAPVSGMELTVLDDPEYRITGTTAVVRLPDGRRVTAIASGRPGRELEGIGVGDRLTIAGRLEPVHPSSWARSRHLTGRVRIDTIDRQRPAAGLTAAVEGIRRRVVAGAAPLPEDLRPLYLGLVVGDDRGQPADQRARFAAGGLAHLLAVSGQNVAFVLAVFRPLIMRASPAGRFAMTLVVLAVFATATRLEPSVLRATVTAGLATWASLGGHRQSGVRLLSLAIVLLVLIDPFLVYSAGFQLSVCASAGILVFGPVLADRLPGPPSVVGATAVTVSAQVAVAPLIGWWFGPVSMMAIPANLLVGWAAGAVMTWGLTVGVLAGVVGGGIGAALQAPVVLALQWVDGVAAWASRVDAPAFTGPTLAVGALLATSLWLLAGEAVARRGRQGAGWIVVPSLRLAAAGLLVALVASAFPKPLDAATELVGGGRWYPATDDGPSVLIVGRDADERLVSSIVDARVTAADVIVVESGGGRPAIVTRALGGAIATGSILAPPQHRIVGAQRVTETLSIAAAGSLITIVPDGQRLSITTSVSSARP